MSFTYPFHNASVVLRLDGNLAVVVIPSVLLDAGVEFLEKHLTLGFLVDIVFSRVVFSVPTKEVLNLLFQVDVAHLFV